MSIHDPQYSDFNGKVYAFIGQNASAGTPHPLTGHMSFYGDYYGPFSNRKEAREYVECDAHYAWGQHIHEIGSARALRKYSLGQSVRRYLEHLQYASLHTWGDL